MGFNRSAFILIVPLQKPWKETDNKSQRARIFAFPQTIKILFCPHGKLTCYCICSFTAMLRQTSVRNDRTETVCPHDVQSNFCLKCVICINKPSLTLPNLFFFFLSINMYNTDNPIQVDSQTHTKNPIILCTCTKSILQWVCMQPALPLSLQYGFRQHNCLS